MKCIQFCLFFILYDIIRSYSKRENYENYKIFIQINDDDDVFTIDLIKSPQSERLLNVLPLSTYLLENNEYIINMPITSIDMDSNCLSFSTNINLNAKKGDMILFKGKEIILVKEPQVFDGEYIKIGYTRHMDEFSNKIKKSKNFVTFSILNAVAYKEHENRLKHEHVINYFILKIITFFISVLV